MAEVVVTGWGKKRTRRPKDIPLFQGAKVELAIALVLWRNLRLTFTETRHTQRAGGGGGFPNPTEECERVNNRALRMARRLGCQAEYLTLVFNLPVTRIYVKEFEEWTNLLDSLRMRPPCWASTDSGSESGKTNSSGSRPPPSPSPPPKPSKPSSRKPRLRSRKPSTPGSES